MPGTGSGRAFTSGRPIRGYEWARAHCEGTGEEPFVIGAVIHLGNCLNLMDRDSLGALRDVYASFKLFHASAHPGEPLPRNRLTRLGSSHALDCAVINHLHWMIEASQEDVASPQPCNTVRGLYQEDEPVFDGSMIRAKTHIQISVLTPEETIQGCFRVPDNHLPVQPAGRYSLPEC
jgi:hypothetical protein